MKFQCVICGHTGGILYSAKEMMLGLRKEFPYVECLNCGCLQLVKVPDDWRKYYPSNYYSLAVSPEVHFRGFFKNRIKALRDYSVLTGSSGIGSLFQKLFPNRSIELQHFKYLDLKRSSKILDVGSGSGTIPYVLRNAGFRNVLGVDPFIERDIQYANGLQIQKKSLFDISETGKWDVIMFNHSFEHLSNPVEHLHQVRKLLLPNGICLIRIPTVSSFAWKHYGVNWVQLDAPRHVFLFSKRGIEFLAQQTSFKMERITSESTSFQFIGSEQYQRNISMYGDEESYFRGNRSLFSQEELFEFQAKTDELNRTGEGDSISIVLRKF